ncbi:hypothetical protein PVAND_012099 [Polypedilum vanderplanki]|uniref:Chromo domain-containing protein n=1 Tax=Polypedilum vanderplanki TaxID=319348 RepID=A0A9J6CMD2_POLVA|nr:hypothetical protein PVAND_012099 [Polypedilum vanderplanki]
MNIKPEKEVYEVEALLNKRVTDDGKIEYLIKWRNYPNSQNTWTSVDKMNCPNLIEDYEKNLTPKRIITAIGPKEKLVYVIKFKNGSSKVISHLEAKQKFPKLLVNYFENCLVLKDLETQNNIVE